MSDIRKTISLSCMSHKIIQDSSCKSKNKRKVIGCTKLAKSGWLHNVRAVIRQNESRFISGQEYIIMNKVSCPK